MDHKQILIDNINKTKTEQKRIIRDYLVSLTENKKLWNRIWKTYNDTSGYDQYLFLASFSAYNISNKTVKKAIKDMKEFFIYIEQFE